MIIRETAAEVNPAGRRRKTNGRGVFTAKLELHLLRPDGNGRIRHQRKALCRIAQAKGDSATACEKAESTSKHLMFDYAMSLFHRAKTLSDHPKTSKETVLQAWNDLTSASKDLVRLYADPADLVVNGFEKNTYCYLITSYTSKCNFLICQGCLSEALSCADNAMNTALEMYAWAEAHCQDPLVLSDIFPYKSSSPAGFKAKRTDTPRWGVRSFGAGNRT